MHAIIWEFIARKDRLQEFVSAYRSDGAWAHLLRQAEGFRGTELLRGSQDPTRFLTVDRWETAACFERFQERFGAQYKELDARLGALTLSEKPLGTFSDD